METKHSGSCHCKAVTFEVVVDPATASRCNCSICAKVSATNAIVKPSAFVQLTGQDDVSSYEWGGKTAKRFFCKHCGIHCFARGYLEQVGGDYVSVNLCTLDGVDAARLEPSYWDGRHDNWQSGPRKTPWPIVSAASPS